MKSRMTERQVVILTRLSHGETLGAVADSLEISRETAKDDCRKIYKQYGVNSQAAAVAAALRQGHIA